MDMPDITICIPPALATSALVTRLLYIDQTSADILYMSHLSLKHVHIMHALSIYNMYIIACICDIILEQVNYTYMYIHM